MITDEQVERAAAAMAEAVAERRQEMREESQRVWGHPGSVTTVRPLSFTDLARVALQSVRLPSQDEIDETGANAYGP